MTIDRRQFAVGSAALAAGSLLPGQALAALAPDAEKALYEAAKKEGWLTWYDAHHAAELAELFGRKFTEKYPGVKVNVVRTTANVAFQRLTQELKAGGPQCDVFSSTDVSHPMTLKGRGELMQFTPANAKTVLSNLQNTDPDGYFHVTSIGTIGITYNTSKVKPEEVPKSWTDLNLPRWKNQVSVGHPAFSGYVSIWVWEMNRLYGWKYFEQMKANNPQIGRSIQDTLTMLRSGERQVASGSLATAYETKAKGEPIGIANPSDGTIIIVAPSGIPKAAKRPNAAKLFMEFMSSAAASQIAVDTFGESIHASVKPKAGPSLDTIKTLIAPPAKLVKELGELKEKWRDTFGV